MKICFHNWILYQIIPSRTSFECYLTLRYLFNFLLTHGPLLFSSWFGVLFTLREGVLELQKKKICFAWAERSFTWILHTVLRRFFFDCSFVVLTSSLFACLNFVLFPIFHDFFAVSTFPLSLLCFIFQLYIIQTEVFHLSNLLKTHAWISHNFQISFFRKRQEEAYLSTHGCHRAGPWSLHSVAKCRKGFSG